MEKIWIFFVYSRTVDKKVKFSRYRPGVAQGVGRGIALFFHDCGTRRGRVVSSTPRPHFTRERPGTHFTGGWVGPRAGLDGRKSRPHRDSIPDYPASSQSLYRLSYPAHKTVDTLSKISVERREKTWKWKTRPPFKGGLNLSVWYFALSTLCCIRQWRHRNIKHGLDA